MATMKAPIFHKRTQYSFSFFFRKIPNRLWRDSPEFADPGGSI
ncbi:hypothetical protein [Cupriavidus sp. WS]|nr:hypothetical protein [Cupriavidus sp. WS]